MKAATVLADLFFVLFLSALLNMGSKNHIIEGEKLVIQNRGFHTVHVDGSGVDIVVHESWVEGFEKEWTDLEALELELAKVDHVSLLSSSDCNHQLYENVELRLQKNRVQYIRELQKERVLK